MSPHDMIIGTPLGKVYHKRHLLTKEAPDGEVEVRPTGERLLMRKALRFCLSPPAAVVRLDVFRAALPCGCYMNDRGFVDCPEPVFRRETLA